jgi:hypothetical protein
MQYPNFATAPSLIQCIVSKILHSLKGNKKTAANLLPLYNIFINLREAVPKPYLFIASHLDIAE